MAMSLQHFYFLLLFSHAPRSSAPNFQEVRVP